MKTVTFDSTGVEVAYVDYEHDTGNGFTRLGILEYDSDYEPIMFKVTIVVGKDRTITVLPLVAMAKAATPQFEIPDEKFVDVMARLGLFEEISIHDSVVNSSGTNFEMINLDDDVADFLRGTIKDD